MLGSMIENVTTMDRFNVSEHNNGTEDEDDFSSQYYYDEETCYRWKVAVLSGMIIATAASNAASLAALAANASRVRRRRLLRQRLQQASLKKHLRPQTAPPPPSTSSLPPTRSDLLRRSSSPMPSSSPSATVNSRPTAPAPATATTTTTSSSSPAASRMYFFLFHLSVADAMTAPLTLLPELLWTLASADNQQGESGWNDALCKVTKYVQMLAPYLSTYLLVLMALDRYQTICYPMHRRRSTWRPHESRRRVIAAWVMALVVCTPQTMVFSQDSQRGGCAAHLGTGFSPKAWVTWLSVSRFFLPLTVMSFCYLRICSALKDNLEAKRRDSDQLMGHHGHAQGQESNNNNGQSGLHCSLADHSFSYLSNTSLDLITSQLKLNQCPLPPNGRSACCAAVPHALPGMMAAVPFAASGSSIRPRACSGIAGISRAKIKSVRQTVVIIAGFVACSAPAVARQLWAVWVKEENNLTYSSEWFFWLVSLNSIVNPWIYLALNKDLQHSLKDLCCFASTGGGKTELTSNRVPPPSPPKSSQPDNNSHQEIFVRPRSQTVQMGTDGRPIARTTCATPADGGVEGRLVVARLVMLTDKKRRRRRRRPMNKRMLLIDGEASVMRQRAQT